MSEEVEDGVQDELDYTMTAYVAADATGAIQFSGTIPAYMIAAQDAPAGGSIVIGNGSAATQYVSGGQIIPRPVNTATLAGMTLSNLPNPCTVTVQGTAHACTDGSCDLEFTQPGTYSVVVSAFPMLDATFQVTQT